MLGSLFGVNTYRPSPNIGVDLPVFFERNPNISRLLTKPICITILEEREEFTHYVDSNLDS